MSAGPECIGSTWTVACPIEAGRLPGEKRKRAEVLSLHAAVELAIRYAWEGAGRIWYAALRHPLTQPRTDFAGFAGITLNLATRLYGHGSKEVEAVQAGWEKVGVRPAG
jgi:hypothetical protein